MYSLTEEKNDTSGLLTTDGLLNSSRRAQKELLPEKSLNLSQAGRLWAG
jgi:hypothetical protein